MRILSLLLVAASLGGCGALGPTKSAEYATFSLNVPSGGGGDAPVSWQLRIDEPLAPTPLASTRIARLDADGGYGVFKGARWSERAPELIQGVLVRAFEDSGRIRGVARSDSALRGDYLLVSELRDFEADYSGGGAPVVRFTLSAKLLDSRSNDAVAARVFSESEAAKGRDINAIVKAFEACAGRVVPAVRDWALAAGKAPESAHP